jgi:presenilin-like A22 family membrane protease
MKHNLKITIILLAMFIVTQLIGLYVVNYYILGNVALPYGFEQREVIAQNSLQPMQFLISLFFSFVLAVLFILFMMKVRMLWFLKAWFFLVISIALGITISILTSKFNLVYPSIFALALGVILAYLKIFRRNILSHNLTELLIYPGIAVIFVQMLNLWALVILLILISIYDIWAVWHSGIMQKMAKFQMNEVKIFAGFFIPYASKKIREKIELLKIKYKNHIPQKEIKKGNIKVSLAILGGGDVVFPIISAGVFLKTFNSIPAALIVIIGATLGLLYLFMFAKKKKYYPAMPYLTTGIFLGMLAAKLLLKI